jgi:hypothetical protein
MSSGGQIEILAFDLELGDGVDQYTRIVWKLGDLLSISVPTHAVAFGLQLRDVDHGASMVQAWVAHNVTPITLPSGKKSKLSKKVP